jgi:hypothetical protein
MVRLSRYVTVERVYGDVRGASRRPAINHVIENGHLGLFCRVCPIDAFWAPIGVFASN